MPSVESLSSADQVKYHNVLKSSGSVAASKWLARKTQQGRSGGGRKASKGNRQVVRSISTGPTDFDFGGQRRLDLVVGVPECAVKYGALCANPFVPSHTACLPVEPTPASYKMTCFVRGGFTIGTEDVGFVMVKPHASAASDADSVYLSTSAYTGEVTATGGTGVTALKSNSSFVAADFGADGELLQCRVVAWGLRIRYMGTELNRGGAIYGYAHPTGHNLVGFGAGNFLAFDEVHGNPVLSDRWTSIRGTSYAGNFLSAVTGSETGAFLVVSTPGNSFEFEAVFHWEVVGDSARGKTPSHPAIAGARVVADVISSNAGATQNQKSLATKIEEGLKSTASLATKASAAAASVGNFIVGISRMKNYFTAGAGMAAIAL